MRTIKINPDFFGKYKTQKELFQKVKIWVRNNLTDKEILHNEIKKKIVLSWQGLKNDLNEFHPPFDMKLLSFSKLDLIIKNSKLIIKEKDKHNKPDVKVIFKLLGSCKINKKEFDVLIIIKETSKTFIYDHILLEKK